MDDAPGLPPTSEAFSSTAEAESFGITSEIGEVTDDRPRLCSGREGVSGRSLCDATEAVSSSAPAAPSVSKNLPHIGPDSDDRSSLIESI